MVRNPEICLHSNLECDTHEYGNVKHMALWRVPLEMRCSNCRRRLGKDLLSCPRRDEGKRSTCQFQVEQRHLPKKGWGMLVAVGLVVALMPVIAYLIGKGLPLWVKGVLSPFLLFGGGAIVTGVFQFLGKETIVFNPVSGQSWRQITLLGIPVSGSVSGAIERIPWQGAPARVMRYPASVASLYRQDSAPDIFSIAMLQLVAQDVILLGQIAVKNQLGRGKLIYVLQPGAQYASGAVHGSLEQRIWEIVGQAGYPGSNFHFKGKDYERLYRSALTLEDVLLMVFEGGQPNPEKFLVSEIVGKEAEELSLGMIRGERVKKLNPGPNTMGKIALDIRSVEQLYRDFWTTDPEHAREILARIDLFILTELPIKMEQD